MTTCNTTSCINCGHNISRNALNCPKCGEKCLDCLLCKRPIRSQDLFRNPVTLGNTFHKDCLRKYFQIPQSVRCSDCNIDLAETDLQTQLLDLSVNYATANCSNCGCPKPLMHLDHSCALCGLLIFSTFQKVEHHPSYYFDDWSPTPKPLHEFCAKSLSKGK